MVSDWGILLLITSLLVILHFGKLVNSDKPQVPCYFIFGDSLVDSGNNNQLNTKWKANYPPYGVDFPEGHSGRFTNGRTSADIIGQSLGFDKFIPPYATVTDDQISKGVNYASGGAGIREETGNHNGDRVSLDKQLLNHNSTISRISRIQGNTTFLNECIYVMNIGSFDFLSNYFCSFEVRFSYNTSQLWAFDDYADVLIQQYSRQLTTLYNMGGRKVVLFGLTNLGCAPYSIKNFGDEGQVCTDMINDALYVFNNRLKPLVEEFNKDKSDARFIFINTTSILYGQGGVLEPSPVTNAAYATPADTQLTVYPCCSVDGEWTCSQNSVPCPVRSSSTYFDFVHPTEHINVAIAERSLKARLPNDAYPYDIHHLIEA